jgi:hypothetical protein
MDTPVSLYTHAHTCRTCVPPSVSVYDVSMYVYRISMYVYRVSMYVYGVHALLPVLTQGVWVLGGCECTCVDGYKSMYVYGVSHAYGSTDCGSNKQLNVFRV